MSAKDGFPDVSSPESFEPAEHAVRMAREAETAEELQRDIIEEAIEEGTEAGRTICGSKEKAKEPLARAFGSVILPNCPIDHRGLIHAGGGHDLRAPTNSVLDIANVLFGGASVVMVTGTRRSDLFLAPVEDQLDEARLLFQNAIGLEVESLEEVIEARNDNRILNPIAANRKLREELAPLFQTVETPHPEFEMQESSSLGASVGAVALTSLAMTNQRLDNTVVALARAGNSIFSFDLSEVDVNFAQLLASELAGAIVLLFFLRLFGGRPTTMVQAAT